MRDGFLEEAKPKLVSEQQGQPQKERRMALYRVKEALQSLEEQAARVCET